jgi:alanyl-tRNA synthetase
VEVETRKAIAAKLVVYEQEVPLADAMEVQGLRAMFGEKYPDPVRMISIGAEIGPLLADPKSGVAENYSVEFCGGTHVRNSGHCGAFAILQELAVSKGNRRVECVTGAAAERAIARANAVEAMVVDGLDAEGIKTVSAELLKEPTPQPRRREIEALIKTKKMVLVEQDKAREKGFLVVAKARAKAIIAEAPALVIEALECNGSNKALNGAIQEIKKKSKGTVVMFFSAGDGAVQCNCVVPKKVFKETGLSATEWMTAVNAVIGGKLGGSDEVAQTKGDQPAKIGEAIEAAKAFAASKLN